MNEPRLDDLERRLREQAATRRESPVPEGLHDRVLARCEPRPAASVRPASTWTRWAAAALVLVALGWGWRELERQRLQRLAPAPVRLLHEVTSEPVGAALRIGDVAFVRRVGADVQAGFARAGERTSAAARVVAERLAGPLRLLTQLR